MMPSLQTLIKIYTTAALDWIWISSGRIFGSRILGGKKLYTLKDFDTIRINRADRLGDAIISKPLLTLFARYIALECTYLGNVAPKIKVIASAYNAAFLAPLEKEGIVVEVASGITSYEYDRSIAYAFWKLFLGFVQSFSRIFQRNRSRLAFVDLVDSVTEGVDGEFIGKKEAVWISSNRGPYSLFFDYTARNRFSGSSKRNLIEAYIEVFSEAFSLPGFRAFVYENMQEFYPWVVHDVSEKNRPILCFVGVKDFRNISISLWNRIICSLAQEYPERMIEIIDAPDGLVVSELKNVHFPANVQITQNPHSSSLADFATWAAERYMLAIGVDGGGINALRPFMSVCSIYTLGNSAIWNSFIGAASSTEYIMDHDWILRVAKPIHGITQMYLFKQVSFLPSFQIPVGKEIFDDLNAEKFVKNLSEV